MKLLRSIHHVDQADLQGNVLAGYGNRYRHALYAFVHVHNTVAARRWLGTLAESVTNAVPVPLLEDRPDCTLNVSLSCNGLRQLGAPEPLLGSFPEEFREGMASRASKLGDTGPSLPDKWPLGEAEHHVLVTLFARNERALKRGRDKYLGIVAKRSPFDLEAPDLELKHEVHARLIVDPDGNVTREHFGFPDGFSQPTIKGNAGPYRRRGGGTPMKRGNWSKVAPGEFVLGYPAEDGTYAHRPVGPLRRSGTFTVVRMLEQKVGAFNRYLSDASESIHRDEEWVAARIVGRWRIDGSPVIKFPDAPESSTPAKATRNGGSSSDSGKAPDNDFRYQQDPMGATCPLGAHIRRTNPRDAFGWEGRPTKRHRIIRRGMPYRQERIEAGDGKAAEEGERGLMFVCHQASIERQFEVIQHQWLNDGDAFWLGAEPDLLTSGASGKGMTIQGEPPKFLPKPEPFIVTKGGGYFFTPGIAALRNIAAAGWL